MYTRWGLNILLVDGILRLLGWVLYPILIYPLRKVIRRLYHSKKWYKWIAFPLWLFLNDGPSNDVGYEWFFRAKGIWPTNWFNRYTLAIMWSSWRNPAWNAYKYIKPNQGQRNNIQVLCGNGITRVLKWKLSDDAYNNNIGDYLDYKKSNLGKNHITYTIDSKSYFMYSKAWIRPFKSFLGNYFVHHELMLGWNSSRALIRCKLIFKKQDSKNVSEYQNYINSKS